MRALKKWQTIDDKLIINRKNPFSRLEISPNNAKNAEKSSKNAQKSQKTTNFERFRPFWGQTGSVETFFVTI